MGEIQTWSPPVARPRILVVEDSDSIRQQLARLLSAPPLSAEVIVAEDGARGLARISELELDCVLCDLEMPILDGRKFLAAVRTKRSADELPVLILTVREALDEKIDRFRAGANDYVTKPWVDEELVARVETQVRIAQNTRKKQRAGATDPLTEVGNLSWLLERAAAELNRAARGGWKVAVIVVDIDGLSTINEEHGREMGDRVLQHAASVLKTGFRRYDGVARTGADEFSILLPDADERVGSFVAKRVKEQIDRSEGPIPFTVSVGCAAGPADPNDDATQLLKRADDKLRGG